MNEPVSLEKMVAELRDSDVVPVIVGPTASGKTELAVRLAEKLLGEVVSADSVQIYREFNLGTGKPSLDEITRAPHHLVDIADPLEPFDANRFASLADEAIRNIQAKGGRPILCGGTFLWVKAVIYGLADMPAASEEIRQKYREMAELEGRSKLHELLGSIDPQAAARLDPNDFVRVTRALEVFELTGKTQSAFFAEHGFRGLRYNPRFIGVFRGREELDQRIELRTRAWLEQGWVAEVNALIERGYRDARAMSSVGFREIVSVLDGGLPEVELLSTIVRKTRVFVRRQRTWIRDLPIAWVTG